MPTPVTPPLVLASSSPYRRALLNKLHIDYIAAAPAIEESPLPNETPKQLALRLGIQKAQALKSKYPNHLIIGSDQVAAYDNQLLGKPGNRINAVQQLQAMSGRTVVFYTSIAVYHSATDTSVSDCDKTTVYFKTLSNGQIERYVDLDRPFDCAGSFKAENLGIALFDKIESEDPNALIGLPLIKLIALLEYFGRPVL